MRNKNYEKCCSLFDLFSREEEDGIVEMLIHAGAKVFYENEDLACPTQLACKTALLKVKASTMLKDGVFQKPRGQNLGYFDPFFKGLSRSFLQNYKVRLM